jgi:hypothetical protein
VFVPRDIIEKMQRARRSALNLIIPRLTRLFCSEALQHSLFVIGTGIIWVVLKDMGEPLGDTPVRKDLLFDSLVSNERERRKPARAWSKVGATYPHGSAALDSEHHCSKMNSVNGILPS